MERRIIEETAKFLEKLLKEERAITYKGDYIAYYRVKYFNDDDWWTYAGIFSANDIFNRTYELDLDISFKYVEDMELIGLTDISDPNNKPQFIKDESI